MDGWIDGLIPTTCYHEWDWLLVHVYFERRFSFDMHMPFSTCFGIERCSFHTTYLRISSFVLFPMSDVRCD